MRAREDDEDAEAEAGFFVEKWLTVAALELAGPMVRDGEGVSAKVKGVGRGLVGGRSALERDFGASVFEVSC